MSCDKKAQEIFRKGVKNGYDVDHHDPRKWKKEPFQRPAWLDEPLSVTKSPSYHSADEKSACGTIEEKKMTTTGLFDEKATQTKRVRLWAEDDATCHGNDPDHETLEKAWLRLFGEKLDTKKALRTEDGGDAIEYHMPNGWIAVGSYPGASEIERDITKTIDMNNKGDVALVKKTCKIARLAEPTLSHFCWFAVHKSPFDEPLTVVTKTNSVLKPKKVGPVWGFETKNHLFLEQNAQKNSEPGRQARQGHKILWVIQKSPNKYIGKIMDGVLEVFEK